MSRSQRRFGRKSHYRMKIRKGESRHHRLPRSRGGGNNHENISIVKQTDHDHYHVLFSNLSVHAIAMLLNEKWVDPRYELVVIERRRETKQDAESARIENCACSEVHTD